MGARIPTILYRVVVVVARERALLRRATGNDPSIDELAQACGMYEGGLRKVLPWLTHSTLCTPTGDGDGSLADFIRVDIAKESRAGRVESKINKESVKRILKSLPPRERRVIQLRFGLNGKAEKTLAAIAKEFGFTAERARQIEASALRSMRSSSLRSKLEPIMRSYQSY